MLSHLLNQVHVPVRSKLSVNRAAVAPREAMTHGPERNRSCGRGRAVEARATMTRWAKAETAVPGDEPVSVQCGEQDRCEGAGVRAGALPHGGAAERGYSELYALRQLDVPALDVGGLDLLDRYEERIALEDPFLQTADDMSFFVPWRRSLPEARPGWSHHGDGLHPRAYRHHVGRGLCRPRQVFPDLGAARN